MTTQRIAELEAEVVRLREALEKSRGALAYCKGNGRDNPNLMESTCWHGLAAVNKVLSTPFTPQHLPALVEKVEKIWREKCASRLDSEWNGDADTYEYSEACNECAERIRTLPVGQIKLEELL